MQDRLWSDSKKSEWDVLLSKRSFHSLIAFFCFEVTFFPMQRSFRLFSENKVFGICISNPTFF